MMRRLTLWTATTVLCLLAVTLPLASQDKKDDKAAAAKKADKNDLPLDPAGKLEFETDEGTWISLDVTPDGKSVVFELLGDIYRVPIAGGDATRLTDGNAVRLAAARVA